MSMNMEKTAHHDHYMRLLIEDAEQIPLPELTDEYVKGLGKKVNSKVW